MESWGLILDANPGRVTGIGQFEEAADIFGDGFEIADEGAAVGVLEISRSADCEKMVRAGCRFFHPTKWRCCQNF